MAAGGAQVEDAPARTTLQISNAPLANVIALRFVSVAPTNSNPQSESRDSKTFPDALRAWALARGMQDADTFVARVMYCLPPFYLFVRCLLMISKTGVCRRTHAEFVSSLSAEDVELCKKPL